MTPFDSDDLTDVSEVHGDELVLLHSPENAEHDPNYREMARFPLGSSR
jgi:hypothetical protein